MVEFGIIIKEPRWCDFNIKWEFEHLGTFLLPTRLRNTDWWEYIGSWESFHFCVGWLQWLRCLPLQLLSPARPRETFLSILFILLSCLGVSWTLCATLIVSISIKAYLIRHSTLLWNYDGNEMSRNYLFVGNAFRFFCQKSFKRQSGGKLIWILTQPLLDTLLGGSLGQNSLLLALSCLKLFISK